jgi:FKBP-type peptidyl-prolyl cis-trans isomerase FkpA/FKBP-type peptidyl-prolyl cis-trans isomerase FklB
MNAYLRRLASLIGIVAIAACAQTSEIALETDDQRALYEMGHQIAQRITLFELTEDELDYVVAGVRDGALGREPRVPTGEGSSLRTFLERRRSDQASAEKEAGSAFAAREAAMEGAQTFESGLVLRTVVEGEGDRPTTADTVRVHYHGTLRDGTVFDSSVDRGEPAVFPLGRVIPCWQEALQKIAVGGKARVVCPPDIAYGDRGSPPTIKPGATLAFDVELLAILKKKE